MRRIKWRREEKTGDGFRPRNRKIDILQRKIDWDRGVNPVSLGVAAETIAAESRFDEGASIRDPQADSSTFAARR